MISYTIVGSSDNQELADLENRCNKVRRAFPGCDFRFVIKHPKEWDDYIAEVCKIYGFKRRHNPTAFIKEGRYIGGYEDMLRELEARFDIEDVRLENEDAVHPDLNSKIAEEDYKHRNRMASLADRIDEEYTNHLKRGDFNFHIEKFETIDLGDRIVFGKYLSKYTPPLVLPTTKEVELEALTQPSKPFSISEALKADMRMAVEAEPEEKPQKKAIKVETQGHQSPGGIHSPDRSGFDEEITGHKRSPHPEEQAKHDGSRSDQNDGSFLKDKNRVKEANSKIQAAERMSHRDEVIEQGPNQPPQAAQEKDNKDGSSSLLDPNKEKDNSIKPPGSSNRLQSDPTNQNLDAEGNVEHAIDEEELERKRIEQARREEIYKELREILPEIKSLKKWHVASLTNNYELCLHPDPIFKKQCILTKNGRLKYDEPLIKYKPYEDKAEKRIRISDFSKVQKFRVDGWSGVVREEELANLQSTTLNSRFLDLKHLFTMSDMHVILDLVRDLDAFVFYRVLPTHVTTNIPYLNQSVHVVRRQHLIDEMNESLRGVIAVDRLHIDLLLGGETSPDIISDQERDDKRQAEIERKFRRDEKMRRIEEKRIRREAREKEERERLEAEAKAAEEAAAKEREALKNPAKAAALRIERERQEHERVANEKVAQEKAANDKAEKERAEHERAAAMEAQTQEQVFDFQENQDGNINNEEGLSPLKGVHHIGGTHGLNLHLMESDFPISDHAFDNPFKASFFKIKLWSIPHKFYKRLQNEETPESLMEAMEYLVLSLVYDHPQELDLSTMGLNLIISKDWVLMVPLTKPWIEYGRDKLFWEPWSYIDFFSFPILQKTWPETSNLESHEFTKDIKTLAKRLTQQ